MDCCCAFLRPIPDSQKRISIRDAEPAERDPKVTVEDVSPVRTGADARASIRLLKEGNTRFTSGNTLRKTTNDTMRKELEIAEAPHCAIIGCADSQVPLETIFDSSPGDIFALRNAGNTCTHAEGSMVGSLEFCISKLKSRLILVLGHTHCSAVYGATKAYFDTVQAAQAGPPDRSERASTALEGLLQDLSCIAEQAASEVGRDGRDGEFEEVAIHAVKINVFHTINFLLKYSSQIRQMVRRRQVEIQGGIYDLASGHVEFLGCSPDQEELLSSKMPLPLSVTARSSNVTIMQWKVVSLKIVAEERRHMTPELRVAAMMNRSSTWVRNIWSLDCNAWRRWSHKKTRSHGIAPRSGHPATTPASGSAIARPSPKTATWLGQ
mmetsp:Transcript_55047/g.111919  ORF Transcript_55047/g.111919 Transcript_55047/m.111919 type:complete len:380 (+) Transcript_55047:45-1184(+)